MTVSLARQIKNFAFHKDVFKSLKSLLWSCQWCNLNGEEVKISSVTHFKRIYNILHSLISEFIFTNSFSLNVVNRFCIKINDAVSPLFRYWRWSSAVSRSRGVSSSSSYKVFSLYYFVTQLGRKCINLPLYNT